MKIVPLNDVVVLREAKGANVTKGGIALPDDQGQQKTVRGEVLAIGPGRWNERLFGSMTLESAHWREKIASEEQVKMCERIDRLPMTVKPGDVVLFERGIGGGYEISVDGEKLFLCREACIVAKLEHE